MILNPDPLTVPEDQLAYEDGLAAGARLRPLHIATLLLLGVFVGSVLTLLGAGIVHAAAPLSASAPSIPVAAQARSGASLRPVGGQAAQSSARVATVPPRSVTAATPQLTGIASWYIDPQRNGDYAAVPTFHWGDKPYLLRVTTGHRSIVVRVVDCLCGRRDRLVDLSPSAFSRLAPLSRGLIQVSIMRLTASLLCYRLPAASGPGVPRRKPGT